MIIEKIICDVCGKTLKSGDINIIEVNNAWQYDCCNDCKDKVENEIKNLISRKG